MCRIYIGLATPILCVGFTLVLPHLVTIVLNLTLNLIGWISIDLVSIILDLVINLINPFIGDFLEACESSYTDT